MKKDNNIDHKVVSDFGKEWKAFNHKGIDDSKLYILVEIDKENTQLLHVYDINTGKVLNRIRLK